MEIKFYTKTSGKSPVLDFINKLSKVDQAKVLGCLQSLQDLGLECLRVQLRQIDGKLWEIKIKTPSGGYRIFYVLLQKESMVLLHVYKKQSQKAPAKEIKTATERLKEVLDNETDYLK